MREALQPYNGQRLRVTARVDHFGSRPRLPGLRERTVLIVDLQVDGRPVCQHLWLTIGRRLAAAQLQQGDTVTFSAWVTTYERGRYREPNGTITAGEVDYKLANPARIIVTRRIEGTPRS